MRLGTRVSVQGNVVTGIGPTMGAAQNGIQIGFGAEARFEEHGERTICGRRARPWTHALTWRRNILVTQSDGVEVTDNDVGISQVGIFLHGNEGLVAQNKTFREQRLRRIRLEGDWEPVRHNQVFNGAEIRDFYRRR